MYIVYLSIFIAFTASFICLNLNGFQLNSNFYYSTSESEDLDFKLIRLSVNTFRTYLFIITSACILAVDFSHFPISYMKSHDFGFGLMDIGVGFFILCHSMRLIRNNNIDM